MRSGRCEVQGTPRKKVVSLLLGFASDDFGYLIDLGLPQKDSPTAFKLDPEIKRECIWHGPAFRPSTALVDRRGPVVRVKSTDDWNIVTDGLPAFDSMMTYVSDPRNAPEILAMREFQSFGPPAFFLLLHLFRLDGLRPGVLASLDFSLSLPPCWLYCLPASYFFCPAMLKFQLPFETP
jgi:hypothetical protein